MLALQRPRTGNETECRKIGNVLYILYGAVHESHCWTNGGNYWLWMLSIGVAIEKARRPGSQQKLPVSPTTSYLAAGGKVACLHS